LRTAPHLERAERVDADGDRPGGERGGGLRAGEPEAPDERARMFSLDAVLERDGAELREVHG
jgi:hypothetical protein